VLVQRKTVTWLWCLALAGAGAAAFSCSVFPDEATLPVVAAGAAGAAVGGATAMPQAGVAGADVIATPGGAGASAGEGGAPSGVGGAPPTGVAGSPDVSGGAGGAACANPQTIVGAATADTWIEALKPNATHGSDKTLSVVGGGQERRALLQLALPTVPTGAVLLRARLALHLESNADVGLALRRLSVHQLEQEVIEGRASWSHWNNGNRTWAMPGGDFGSVLAQADVPAGVSDAALTFDVTVPVQQALAAKLADLPFIVLETSAPPPAPAGLAFTAMEGNASGIPALILEYCEP
jgi:hypothetical protein